ncbi:MerR family transcriptional regulator [Tundrisphaera lichenicola]|uniref:MerR family transcriptional regulator n=1 Tax=Tundrisphaera lichenicola TaxID=2029860 RepID=UPI003EB7B4D1
MTRIDGAAAYSIAAVSKLTGVSCHALRVWERRYGFPIPMRSDSGHRRYTQEQVGVLRVLARLGKSGRPIGELISEYQAGRLDLRLAVDSKIEEKTSSIPLVDILFSGNLTEAEILLDRLAHRLGPLEQIERIFEPALIEIGERWFRGECEVFQEHCSVGLIMLRLGRLLEQARRANHSPERKALVGTVKGDRHEGGVLMVSLALELAGWRAIPMGCDMPVSEYAKAADAWQPDAIAVSFVLSRNINKRFQELAKIRGLPIFVGGRSIVNHQGLARRYGLIPLTGALTLGSSILHSEFDQWQKKKGCAATPAMA